MMTLAPPLRVLAFASAWFIGVHWLERVQASRMVRLPAAALGGGHAATAGGRRVVRPDTTCGNTHSVSEVGLAGVGVSLALKRAWIACGSVT